MSASSFEPPLTPAAQQQQQQANGGIGNAHRRELTPQELATLPVQALLVRTGQLTLDQLSEALRENVASGQSVEEIAVARGWVAPDELQRLREAKAQYAPEAAAAPAPPTPPAPAPVAPAPEPAPIAFVPEPAPAPAPVVQAVPDPPPVQPVVQAPAPVAAPAPEPIAVTVPPPSPNSSSVGVFLHLEDGERIWVGRFENQEAGELHAQHLIDALMRPEPGVWPRFGDRLVRPESVVGVEVVPRTD
jgi:hypothetical protein